MNYEIEIDEFCQKEIKSLKKRFKLIKNDITDLMKSLKENPFIGIHLKNNIYKIRIPNSSIPTGKSGGFRVIYYVIIEQKIILLKIYSKTDKSNINDEELKNLEQRIKQ